ncbi:FAD-dependent monooxygenase [Streptomyces mirabilis]|uniref:FAD-dependent monooxygenase n=1 Tax=Streptomyces mirabilis TaxID=68239 RepID=UPI0033B0B46E
MCKPTPPAVEETSVLVVGAGPVGLTLAMELEHHGVEALLVERNTPAQGRHPHRSPHQGDVGDQCGGLGAGHVRVPQRRRDARDDPRAQ